MATARQGAAPAGFDEGAKPKAAAGKDLVVFDQNHPLMEPLFAQEVLAVVDERLKGSGLTARQLVMDLGATLSLNKELQEHFTADSAYHLLLLAGNFRCSFGDGGLWVLPNKGSLRGQPSEKLLVERAKERAKLKEIRAVLVFKGQKIGVTRDPRTGFITDVMIEDPEDFFSLERTPATLVGGFGIAIFEDGDKRIYDFDRADLERRKEHSAAVKAHRKDPEKVNLSPMWLNDELQAHERGIRAGTARFINPIPTQIAGVTGNMKFDASDPDDDSTERADAGGPRPPSKETVVLTPESVKAELKARTQAAQEKTAATPPPTPPRKQGGVATADFSALTGDALKAACPAKADFSGAVQAKLEAKDMNPVKRLIAAFGNEWPKLEQMPDALQIKRQEIGEEIGGNAEQDELRLLGEARLLFWQRAKQAGYPQPE